MRSATAARSSLHEASCAPDCDSSSAWWQRLAHALLADVLLPQRSGAGHLGPSDALGCGCAAVPSMLVLLHAEAAAICRAHVLACRQQQACVRSWMRSSSTRLLEILMPRCQPRTHRNILTGEAVGPGVEAMIQAEQSVQPALHPSTAAHHCACAALLEQRLAACCCLAWRSRTGWRGVCLWGMQQRCGW